VSGSRASLAGEQRHFSKVVPVGEAALKLAGLARRINDNVDVAGVDDVHGIAGIPLGKNNLTGRDVAQQQQARHLTQHVAGELVEERDAA
jgi:hypothetical protein